MMAAAAPVKSIISGGSFGVALTTAGMYSPAIIIGQFRFENFHMLTTFLVACASSTLAIFLARRASFSNCRPRPASSLSLFPYDGNIIGGAILGCGMAISGACTGTVLPQIVTGILTAPYVFAGQLLGGILFSKFGRPLMNKDTSESKLEKTTVYERLGTGKNRTFAIYEALCLSIIATCHSLLPIDTQNPTLVAPISGGLLIGVSQFITLGLTAGPIGISTAYEQVGDLFWWPFNSNPSLPSLKSCPFAFGTILGSFALFNLISVPAPVPIEIENTRALVGGVLLVVGSRLAGGCTSGHGISGMAMLGVSSLLTVIAMFAGGVALSAVLK